MDLSLTSNSGLPELKAKEPCRSADPLPGARIENASNMRKGDMMFAILGIWRKGVEISGDGVLGCSGTGSGFLRSPRGELSGRAR